MIVAGRGARRLLNAAMSGAIAVLSVAVLGVAGPVAAAHPAAAYPRPQLTEPQVDPTPEPTPTDLPTTPPPPPPPPPPAPGVKINAADVTLGPSYWQGSVTKGAMTVQVTNTGDSAELVTLTYTLPPGVHDTGPACPCTATLKAGDVWTVNVVLAVDPDAWRRAPLAGTAVAAATVVGRADLGARDQDGYSIMLPPGPPVPGRRAARPLGDRHADGEAGQHRLGTGRRRDRADHPRRRERCLVPHGLPEPAPDRCAPGAVRAGPGRRRYRSQPDLQPVDQRAGPGRGAAQRGGLRIPDPARPGHRRGADGVPDHRPAAEPVRGTVCGPDGRRVGERRGRVRRQAGRQHRRRCPGRRP